MKRYHFNTLRSGGGGHVASGLVPGARLSEGGLSFHTPGMRTHDDGPHVHDREEVFCIMQGKGVIEVNGVTEPIQAGDVIVIEPGEDHHIIGDPNSPIVNCWFHADDKGHPRQYPEP